VFADERFDLQIDLEIFDGSIRSAKRHFFQINPEALFEPSPNVLFEDVSSRFLDESLRLRGDDATDLQVQEFRVLGAAPRSGACVGLGWVPVSVSPIRHVVFARSSKSIGDFESRRQRSLAVVQRVSQWCRVRNAAMCTRVLRAYRVCWLVALSVLLSVGVSRAESCPAARAWVTRCAASGPGELSVVFCPEGRLVVDAVVGDTSPLQIDISRGDGAAFRRVGEHRISPVGEFAEWNDVDPRWRAAFDQVTECVRREPPPGTAGVADPTHQEGRAAPFAPFGGGATPGEGWRLWAGLLCGVVLLVRRLERATVRERGQQLAIGIGLFLVALGYRYTTAPFDFFHQNGQGPLWVLDALCSGGSPYGSGNAEIFGGPLWWFSGAPSETFFWTQSVLGALGPPSVWLLARSLGLAQGPALALALVPIVEPMLARMAGSESYYATMLHLNMPVAAMMASATRAHAGRQRTIEAVLIIFGSGLLISQAARVHPLGWLPAALLPAIAALGHGTWRPRLARAATLSLLVGVVVLATTGAQLFETFGAGIGVKWRPAISVGGFDPLMSWLAVGWVLVIALAIRHPGPGAGLLVLAAAGTAWSATHKMFGLPPPAIRAAYGLLFAPIVLAGLAALIAELSRAAGVRVATGVSLALAGGVLVTGSTSVYDPLLERPTDVLEQRAARIWAEDLPGSANVTFLSRAGQRVLSLPLYGRCAAGRPADHFLSTTHPPPRREVYYYYRSSLCATDDGSAFCDEVERDLTLTQIFETALPARASMFGLDYARDPVVVSLYRVERSP
jgi:hypothetical protein